MRWSPLLLLVTWACSACMVRGPGLFPAIVGTAIVTAAVVSATQPPPARVVYVPEPRPGYAWQPGYWTLEDQGWVWIDGRWIALQPGYAWSPVHWEQDPDGSYRLVPGRWVPAPTP
jgi:YXWGXW repeat-containing protein